MFDAMKLLGSMAENHSAPSAANRFGAAVQQGSDSGALQQLLAHFGATGGQPGGLNSLLGGLTGQGGASGPAPPQGGLGGMLGGFAELAKQAVSSPRQQVESNNPAAIGGVGALAGALLGGGRGALGGGLMAVLGSLAYSALQNKGAGTANAPPTRQVGAGVGPMASAGTIGMAALNSQADMQRKAVLMIRSMIQAAKADGSVDQQELGRIMGKLDEHGHDDEARQFVASEMRRPIDIAGLVRDVATPQEAAEVYAASLMTIEVDSQAERDYLADLATALRLPGIVVTQIHSALGVPI